MYCATLGFVAAVLVICRRRRLYGVRPSMIWRGRAEVRETDAHLSAALQDVSRTVQCSVHWLMTEPARPNHFPPRQHYDRRPTERRRTTVVTWLRRGLAQTAVWWMNECHRLPQCRMSLVDDNWDDDSNRQAVTFDDFFYYSTGNTSYRKPQQGC